MSGTYQFISENYCTMDSDIYNNRIYYQYNPGRLAVCTLPVHALLHLAQDIRQAGPVWCYWAFPMERFCGKLSASAKSRRWPYRSLSYRICDMEHLNQIKILYDLGKELDLENLCATTGQSFDNCECAVK